MKKYFYPFVRLIRYYYMFFLPLLIFGACFYYYVLRDLPSPTALGDGSPSQSTQIFDRNDTLLYTIYADKNHNSWDTTYNTNDALYNWLLAQKKFRYKEVKLNNAILKKYEGWYVGEDRDTAKLMVTSRGLTAIHARDTVVLKPASDNLFFLAPDRNMDFRFTTEKNGQVGFWFLGERKLFYRRVQNKK